MSGSAVEVVRRAFRSYQERDVDALTEILHPEVVAVLGAPLAAKHVYRGHAEVFAMLRARDAKYAHYEVNGRVFTLTPDGRVLVEGLAVYQPFGDGHGAAQRFFWVYEIRDDMIVRMESFSDRGEALAAAGLPAVRPG
jgi:ketosteroid isomerase-like protein